MPIRESQARPAYAPPRSAPARPPDWALGLGPGSRPAPLASISVHRLRHQPPSPPAQNHLGASSSVLLVDRPLSTPTATRRLADALRRGPRRYKTRSKQGRWALLQRESRCVLFLPAPPLGPPRRPSLARSSSSTLRGRDDELTRAPRAQGGHARRVDGRVERCRSWRSTSSGSSRSLYVSPALSTRVARLEHALLRLCELRADLFHLARRSVEPSMAPLFRSRLESSSLRLPAASRRRRSMLIVSI